MVVVTKTPLNAEGMLFGLSLGQPSKKSGDPNEAEDGKFLTASGVGQFFDLSANKLTRILSQLGWLKTGSVKGWNITDQGLKLGGIQDRGSTIPHTLRIRWPENITGVQSFG